MVTSLTRGTDIQPDIVLLIGKADTEVCIDKPLARDDWLVNGWPTFGRPFPLRNVLLGLFRQTSESRSMNRQVEPNAGGSGQGSRRPRLPILLFPPVLPAIRHCDEIPCGAGLLDDPPLLHWPLPAGRPTRRNEHTMLWREYFRAVGELGVNLGRLVRGLPGKQSSPLSRGLSRTDESPELAMPHL
jgi:hypothetical protein